MPTNRHPLPRKRLPKVISEIADMYVRCRELDRAGKGRHSGGLRTEYDEMRSAIRLGLNRWPWMFDPYDVSPSQPPPRPDPHNGNLSDWEGAVALRLELDRHLPRGD
jgi:hypothetical protein